MTYPGTIPHVVAVEPLGEYKLRVTFDDGLVRELDYEGRLRGHMFEPLKDPEYFARVYVDDETGTIAWPHGLDLDPVVLHGDEEPIGPPLRVLRESRVGAP